MSNIFDLSKVIHLGEKERPVCAAVIDTNVLMNEPNPDNWKITAGPTLFILSDGIIQELEYLKQKGRKDNPDLLKKADKAIKHMRDFFPKGKITEGISIPGGWAIAVPSPKQSELEKELEQIADIVKAFHPSDSKLLLLTRECSEQLTAPVVLTTGEVNLFNIMQMNGVPSHMFTGFPIDVPKEVGEAVKDWDRALRDMEQTTKQNSIEVTVTLLAKRSSPTWITKGNRSAIIAEGNGVIRDGIKNRPFFWTILYHEMFLINPLELSGGNEDELPVVHLDFIGEDDFEQSLFDAVADRIMVCANPSIEAGPVTLQSPVSVMKSLLISEYEREEKPTNELKQGFEKYGNDCDYLECLLESEWLDLTVDQDEIELIRRFIRFREAMTRYWILGQRYVFRIMVAKDNMQE